MQTFPNIAGAADRLPAMALCDYHRWKEEYGLAAFDNMIHFGREVQKVNKV